MAPSNQSLTLTLLDNISILIVLIHTRNNKTVMYEASQMFFAQFLYGKVGTIPLNGVYGRERFA